MRGKPVCTGRNFPPYWITPAGAGKTAKCKADSRPPKDHPRRCGENSSSKTACRLRAGSPPQVRGKLPRCNSDCWTNQDHPRRCGENAVIGFVFFAAAGSPPQVRGKLRSRDARTLPFRITPAGAGKTMFAFRFECGHRDHPRRCGENLSTFRHHRK